MLTPTRSFWTGVVIGGRGKFLGRIATELRRRGDGGGATSSLTKRWLNRFLFDASEVQQGRALLDPKDYRTIHAALILGLHNGDTVRAGIVSEHADEAGYWTDQAPVSWTQDPEGQIPCTKPIRHGKPPGYLSVSLDNLQSDLVEDISKNSNTPHHRQECGVSLILALPRPLQLSRILPMISQLGVDKLVLTGAHKVPKDYFGSHLFQDPKLLRERLIEGLCQSGSIRLPQVYSYRSLEYFFRNDLETLFPANEYARVLAHPERVPDAGGKAKEDGITSTDSLTTTTTRTQKCRRMRHVEFPSSPSSSPQATPRMVIAVGPEGGWDEPKELDRFEDLQFQQVSMGHRTLRSDCAIVSLLALAHDVLAEERTLLS